MTALEIVKNSLKILDDKKAEDLTAIRVKDLTILAEYFVIASGTNITHVRAMADEIEFKFAEMGLKPYKIEGYQSGNWIILDYADVVIHIFDRQSREFYTLERLWADGDTLDVAGLLDEK